VAKLSYKTSADDLRSFSQLWQALVLASRSESFSGAGDRDIRMLNLDDHSRQPV